MTSDADWSPTVPRSVHVTRDNREATASGIYGVIVSAAVMSASHAEKAYQVIIAVLVTLTIYWGAERYARIVAERIHEGHRPSWTTVRHQLTHGWEMVTASTLPLVVLAVTSILGAELVTAVLAALVCSTVLLCVAGWAVGRGGRLSPGERLASTVVAGMFGLVFILLKALLH
ncbi:MAG TPA: hypothetical protein VFI44_05750 [Ornithinibacter sp.]|nr:hypothetical protein [Ornithinibacter sp.]